MSNKRIRVNRYGISKSARLLSKYLEVKMLLVTGSRFVGKSSDVVINWGNGKSNGIGNARQINKLHNVQLASNKLRTLETLQEAGVRVPYHSIHKNEFSLTSVLYGRSELYGHSGSGIYVGTRDEIPDCPLYVLAIDKVAEYRAIVVGNEVVDFKKKKKKRGEEYNTHVWNLDGGYIFARNDFDKPMGANMLGISAVSALGLDFGAVDIIEDEEGVLYVLEVNTAFGIEGQTLALVGDKLKELIYV